MSTQDDEERRGFPTTPWDYTDTHLPDDPQAGWAEATVWDSSGDLVCAVSTQIAGSGEMEYASDRARLIAKAGTAAQEAREMGYDPIDAIETLPELLEAVGEESPIASALRAMKGVADFIEEETDSALGGGPSSPACG